MLARRKPLRRKTPLRSFSRTKKYATRERDKDYMAFVHWCKCALLDATGVCQGPLEADHAGKKTAAFHKADDTTCIPLCRRHHRARTDIRGFFKGWGANQMRVWLNEKIRFYRNLYKNLTQMNQTPWRRERKVA